MKVDYDPDYGADRDGNRGVPMWDADMDGSDEENEEVAEKICEALLDDGEIDIDSFNITLVSIEYTNCKYSSEYDETFCDEREMEFDFDIEPIDYMNLVIPKLLEEVDEGWGVDEMSCLLYLERDLLKAKYEGKELADLTKVVEPFREEWVSEFLGEE